MTAIEEASTKLLGWIFRYSLAIAAVAAGFGLRLGLVTLGGPSLPTYITFYPMVMVVALLAGFGPGTLTTALSGAVVSYFILPPVGHWKIASTADRLGLAIFICMGVFMSVVAELYRRSRNKAAAYDREASLRESHARLAWFAAATFEGIVESEAGRIVDCNEQLSRILGYTVDELRGMEIASMIPPEDRDRVMADIVAGQESAIEHPMRRKDGTRIIVEAHGRPMFPGSAQRLTAIRDVTERREREEELRRVNRALRALGNSSQARMRATEERAYLQEVCKIISEDCGHTLVWIGYAEDDESKNIRPVAYVGFEEGHIEALKLTWADTERGRGPSGTVIRTGKPVFCRDMATDPLFAPWRQEALRRGYAFYLVLPLKAPGKERPFGEINIYFQQEHDPFTDDEVRLLTALADDLAQGIATIRARIDRDRAEDAIRDSRAKLKAALASMPDAVFISDTEGRYVEINDAFAAFYRFKNKAECPVSFAQFRELLDFFMADGEPAPFEMLPVQRALRGETATSAEYTLQRKDTGESWIGSYNFAPIRDDKGVIAGCVVAVRDITQRKQAEVILRTTLQRLYVILSSMYIGVLLVTDDGRVEFANQAVCDQFGLEDAPADLVGISSAEMIEKIKNGYLHPDEAAARIREILDRREQVRGEELTMRNGRTCLRDFVPVRVDGKPYGRLWIHSDITQQKRTAEALRASKEELFKSYLLLEQKVGERTRELTLSLASLQSEMAIRKQAEEQLRDLSDRLLRLQDEERSRIARDLHDSTGQVLAALKMDLTQVERLVAGAPNAEEIFGELKALADQAMQEIRTVSHLLHPPLLDELGFASAAKWYVDGFAKRSGIEIKLELSSPTQLDRSSELALYRVLQESLMNVVRHSGSPAVEVRLYAEGENCVLTIRDFGKGISSEVLANFTQTGGGVGVGLGGMKQRMRGLGGQLWVESDASGTTVFVSLPKKLAPAHVGETLD